MRAAGADEYKAWRQRHGYKQRTWTHSTTCVTPLKKLTWFVDQILEAVGPLEEVGVMVRVVLSTNHLDKLRAQHDISEPVGRSPFHLTHKADDTRALLIAAFADPVDFSLFSVPKRLVLFADHDEYTSIFGMSTSTVSRIVAPLKIGGVAFIEHEPEQP